MVIPKILYRIYFSYEHSYEENLNNRYYGEFCESVELALQSVFSEMDNFDKDEARILFPQKVDVDFKKVVVIDNEEYFTEKREFNLVDKNDLMKRFKDFVEGKV